jgi:hypothetical protein
MLVAAVVILAGVVVVASGRGGELAATEPDYPPIDLGPVTSADVALLRPPSAAWGYNMRVTDEALEVIAQAVTERDVQIAALEQEVSDLRDQLNGGGPAAPAGSTATAPGAPITRPEPIYHAEEPGSEEIHFGPGAAHSEPATETSAPWGPAELPEDEPLWEPAHPHPGHAISWEAPAPGASALGERGHPPTVEEAPPAEVVHETEPEPQDGAAAAPRRTGGEITPATGWPAPEPPTLTGEHAAPAEAQAAPAGEQAAPEPADRSGAHDFLWDEDPHQRVVWGAEHARAKAARATEETVPNAAEPGPAEPPSDEPPSDDRD